MLNYKKKNDELNVSYEKINMEIYLLNIKINELQENKTIDVNLITLQDNISSDKLSDNTNIVFDELCNLNTEIPRIHMETINYINDDIVNEFVESLSLDYDCSESGNVSSLGNSEKCSIKSRTRSTSVTDINWSYLTLTKKIIFG